MIKLKGRVHIGRRSSNVEDDFIVIEVQDRDAAAMICEVKMSLADFARALTSQEVSAEINYHNSDHIGKVMEHKREVVIVVSDRRLEKNNRDHMELIQAALAPYEEEGWQADLSDFFNHHRWIKDSGYSVTFRRWV